MPLDENQKFIFDAICKSVCPFLNKKYLSQRKIKKELNFFMDIYKQALLHTECNEALVATLEKIMLAKIGFGHDEKNSNMFEARYRIKRRAKLDANPETAGIPIGPASMHFYIFKLKRNEAKTDLKMLDEHPFSGVAIHTYPTKSTCKELIEELKARDLCHDGSKRKMSVYLSTNIKKTYSTNDLLCLEQQVLDYDTMLDKMVDMKTHTVDGIILFNAED